MMWRNIYGNFGDYLSLSPLFIMIKGGLINGILKNLFDRKKEENTSSILELPVDVMEIILQDVSLKDRVRMGKVCRCWRKLVKDGGIRHPPWLLVAKSGLVEKDKVIRLYNIWDDWLVKVDLPCSITNYSCWRYFASSNGWLVILTEPGSKNHGIFLFDPLSSVTLILPSLCKHSFFDDYMDAASQELINVEVNSIMNEIIVFKNSDDDIVVAATFTGANKKQILGTCKPGDSEWTLFDDEDSLGRDYAYTGMLFYKGTLHVIRSIIDPTTGTVQHHQDEPASDHTLLMLDGTLVTVRLVPIILDNVVDNCYTFIAYLVESRGEVLQILQPIDADSNTVGFDLFKLGDDMETYKKINLGDLQQVLFVSDFTTPFSVNANSLPNEWRPKGDNIICFERSDPGTHLEFGICNNNNNIRLIPHDMHIDISWFTPNYDMISL